MKISVFWQIIGAIVMLSLFIGFVLHRSGFFRPNTTTKTTEESYFFDYNQSNQTADSDQRLKPETKPSTTLQKPY